MFVTLRERGEEALGKQRCGFEFVAPDGKSEDGQVNGAGTKSVEENGRDFFHDRELCLRKFAGERSDLRREEIGRDGGNDAHADGTADGVLEFDDFASNGFQFAKHGASAREKSLAYVSEPYRAAETVEEARAEFPFEFHDLLREGQLRNERLLGGAVDLLSRCAPLPARRELRFPAREQAAVPVSHL
jgi:hypothetical protein